MSEISDKEKHIEYNDKIIDFNNVIELKRKETNCEKNYSNEQLDTLEEVTRVERKNEIALVEFVLRLTSKGINLSIESLSENNSVNKIFTNALQEKESIVLCKKICREIDNIMDIDNNAKILKNIIKSVSKDEQKISIFSLYMAEAIEYNDKDEIVNSDVEVLVYIQENGLKYLRNNEFIRLREFMSENLNDFIMLGSILYWAIEDHVINM